MKIFYGCLGDFLVWLLPRPPLTPPLAGPAGQAAFNKLCIVLWLHSHCWYCCCLVGWSTVVGPELLPWRFGRRISVFHLRLRIESSFRVSCSSAFFFLALLQCFQFIQLPAAKFFPPENAASAFYKFSIVCDRGKKEVPKSTKSATTRAAILMLFSEIVIQYFLCQGSSQTSSSFLHSSIRCDTWTVGCHFKWICCDNYVSDVWHKRSKARYEFENV